MGVARYVNCDCVYILSTRVHLQRQVILSFNCAPLRVRLKATNNANPSGALKAEGVR